MQRQAERHTRFQTFVVTMPYWETWTEQVKRNGETIERGNCRRISRRTRRDMARQRARREYRAAHNLPEPQHG
ncbi:MAG TPA: hypothetical protein VL866_24200 [Pyrinomonadaceae bacterium]|nr:hypothetical protein [Pyrinomonadaceae bacterium]